MTTSSPHNFSPLKPTGLGRPESWLRARGFTRLANLLGRIDEIGLGR